MNYTIHTKDGSTGEGLLSDIYLLQSDGGSAIVVAGAPVAFQTDINGNYTFTNDNAQLFARIQSTGYASRNITLQPGTNEIALSGVTGPEAVIQTTRTFWNKYKTAILLLLILIAVVAAIKYKLV